MRQIEENMVNAVNGLYNYNCGNTRVEIYNNEVAVRLHQNYIFRIVDGVSYFTLAGWNTNTTRSRLNALGVEIHNKKGVPYYKGQPVPTNGWVTIL